MKNWFDTIKEHYLLGRWNREQVLAVVGKALTAEEAEEILSFKKA